jgi:hypothetical protein
MMEVQRPEGRLHYHLVITPIPSLYFILQHIVITVKVPNCVKYFTAIDEIS